MRILCVVCGAIFTLTAFGGTIQVPIGDPQVAELAPSVPGGGGPPISHIGGLLFSFLSTTGTSPSQSPCIIGGIADDPCDFVNVSGQTWQKLAFIVSPGSALTSCTVIEPFFTTCSVDQQGNATLPSILTFSGGPGIQSSEAFSLAVVGWGANTNFSVSANDAPPVVASPEPATILTMFAASALFVAARKRFHCHS